MDLQELFARLKSSNPADAPPTTSSYHPPTVSSPIASPAPSGPQPHHASAIISPNTSAMNTPTPEASGPDRTANLLNLLKFNHSSPSAPATTIATASDRRPSHSGGHNAQGEIPGQGRAISASDLVASFMRKPSSSVAVHSPALAASTTARSDLRGENTPSTENPQDLLLRLLNHKQGSNLPSAQQSVDMPSPVGVSKPFESAISDDIQLEVTSPAAGMTQSKSSIRVFGTEQGGQSTTFEPVQSETTKPVFTYVNPFEQLPTSTPPRRTPQPQVLQKPPTQKIEILKHNRDSSGSRTGTDGKDESSDASGPVPKAPRLDDGKPAPAHTVSEALHEVAEQVDKEVQEALNSAESSSNGYPSIKPEGLVDKATMKELESAVQETVDVAANISKELEDDKTMKSVEEALSKPVANALKDVADEVAQTKVSDSWEMVAAESGDGAAKTGDFSVPVYNFPMKPFVSIDIKLPGSPIVFREDTVMAIARSKKEFDQMDRNLVTASKNFICFAHAKHGSVRVVRQATGESRQAFSGNKERIFNVLMCTANTGQSYNDAETVLGTGVNGSIFWVPVMSSRGNIFEQDELNDHSLIFPAATAHEDNTSGGQLKTRAKTSSRHPEFFAVGRGKNIHLIYPTVATSGRYINPKTRVCDSEKYLKERTLKIITGKAGKDFAFSEDDTVIVSLDKAGKMRFWDIRELTKTSYESPSGPVDPVEIRVPLLTLHTTSSTDKSWPTSVMFLDKERPFTKGIALRYLIVGMKQNHTLQLWDLGLGKAVQEINLPHENESDAICSIGYHPKTGILAICHPTRNSIYLIHVSAPRYNLNVMSQAKYLKILSDNLNNPPKVDATAIMSGIREFSFAHIGQLRSLHLLAEPDTSNLAEGDEGALFELYVMHSHGVACLAIKRDDLGWNKDSVALKAINAEAKGAIGVNQLRQPLLSESSLAGESTAQTGGSSQGAGRDAKKDTSSSRAASQSAEAVIRASTLAKVESKQDAVRAAIINGAEKAEKAEKPEKSEKSEKKKKKKSSSAGESVSQATTSTSRGAAAATSSTTGPASYSQAVRQAPSPPTKPTTVEEGSAAASLDTKVTTSGTQAIAKKDQEVAAPLLNSSLTEVPEWAQRLLAKGSEGSSAGVGSLPTDQDFISREFSTLYKRVEEDRRVQDAANTARQDAVLRLVSSTLTENVEKTMTKLVSHNVRNLLLPSITETVTATLDRRLAEALGTAVHQTIPQELRSQLPSAISRSLQEPDFMRLLTELTAAKINSHIDGAIVPAIRNSITSSLNAMGTAQTGFGETERRLTEQLKQAEILRQRDAAKIDQLSDVVRQLTQTVQSMALAQADFQTEFMKLQSQSGSSAENVTKPATAGAASIGKVTEAPIAKSPEEEELETIANLLAEGSFEEGTIMWLQSPRQAELFDSLFVRCNPTYIGRLSPLVALSVSAAVTASLDRNIPERLHWLDAVLANIDPMDPEIVEVAPRIMDVLSSRLQAAYMHIAENEPSSLHLRRISTLARRALDLKTIASRPRPV